MRIAFLAHSFPRFPGDTHGTFVKALAEAVSRRGHEVHALVPFDPELRPDPASPLRIHAFRYVWPDALHQLGYSRTLQRDVGMKLIAWLESPLYFAFAERALARLARRERIELIHAHWVLPNGWVGARVAKRLSLPLAITLHGSDVFMAERNGLFRRMAADAVEQASYISSCSADLSARLGAIAGPAGARKLLLVPNGTELDGAGGAGAAEAEAPEPVAPGERRLVAVGRLVDKKGFEYLIDALPLVLAKCPEARLVIGGGGVLEEPLRARARALGVEPRVRLTGALSHQGVLGLIASAEVFVMPSVRDPSGNIDGLPIVVLEAMAASKPVVASAISGIPLAIQDGTHGRLVPEKSPEALAAAVLDLLEDPERARALGRAGRARVRDELNWDAIAKRHDELYAEARS